MSKKTRSVVVYVLVLVGLVAVFMYMLNSFAPKTESIKYSEVISYFQESKVKDFEINLGTGELTAKIEGKTDKLTYTVPNVSLFITLVEPMVTDYNKAHPDSQITYNYLPIEDNSWIWSYLPTFLVIGAMVVF